MPLGTAPIPAKSDDSCFALETAAVGLSRTRRYGFDCERHGRLSPTYSHYSHASSHNP